jgi:hypothetical protein
VKYTQLRLFLCLHPGRGHDTIGELHLRWGRLAAFRRSRRSRRSLNPWQPLTEPDQHSLLLDRTGAADRL